MSTASNESSVKFVFNDTKDLCLRILKYRQGNRSPSSRIPPDSQIKCQIFPIFKNILISKKKDYQNPLLKFFFVFRKCLHFRLQRRGCSWEKNRRGRRIFQRWTVSFALIFYICSTTFSTDALKEKLHEEKLYI